MNEISTVRSLTPQGLKTTKEIAPRGRFNTILSATSASIPPAEQNAAIWSWQGAADRVIISGTTPLSSYPGLIWHPNGQPTLASVLTGYMLRIPGNEVFLICAPNISIDSNQKGLFDDVAKFGPGWTWASYFYDPSREEPVAFAMSASAMPYIMRYIPATYPIDGTGWAVWLHENLAKAMGATRYFDATKYKMVSSWKKPS